VAQNIDESEDFLLTVVGSRRRVV